MRCAVAKCKQTNHKKSSSGKSVSFYTFPKDATQRKLWVMFCNRKNTVNANERICSLHFKQEDFERNLKFEMGFSNRRTPKLKPGAIPTIKTNAIANEIARLTSAQKYTIMEADIKEDNMQPTIKSLETKIDALRHENDRLKMLRSPAITIHNFVIVCMANKPVLNNTQTSAQVKLEPLSTDQIKIEADEC